MRTEAFLLVRSDYNRIVHYELRLRNKTINSDVYSEQLTKLNEALQQKHLELLNRKNIIFHHDNGPPHSSFPTRQELLEYSWDA